MSGVSRSGSLARFPEQPRTDERDYYRRSRAVGADRGVHPCKAPTVSQCDYARARDRASHSPAPARMIQNGGAAQNALRSGKPFWPEVQPALRETSIRKDTKVVESRGLSSYARFMGPKDHRTPMSAGPCCEPEVRLGRTRLPALPVAASLFLDNLGARGPPYGDAAQLLARLPNGQDGILEPVLQLPHDPVPVHLRAADHLFGVALSPLYDLASPPLGASVQLRLRHALVRAMARVLDDALGLLLGRRNYGPTLPPDLLRLRQLPGQRSP